MRPLPLLLVLSFIGVSCARSPEIASPVPAPLASVALEHEAAERGRIAVNASCASCHAVGRTGASPFADATPFRDIVQRYSLEDLEEGFAEGLVTAHPAMPEYVFRASEIDDLIAYLQALKDEKAQP